MSFAEEGRNGLARRQRVLGETVAEVGEREAERAMRRPAVLAMASGTSAKQCRHFGAGVLRWRSALRASRRPASSSVVLCARQVKTSSTSRALRSAWQTPLVATRGRRKRARQIDGGLIAGFFVAVEMALEFDIDVAGSEGAGEAGEGFGGPAVCSGVRGRADLRRRR